MAGNYPDPTSWRMALDRDGSVLLEISALSGNVWELTPAQVLAVVNESGDLYTGHEVRESIFAVVFPELRDIDAWFISEGQTGDLDYVHVSSNTTNGVDGTWTSINSGYLVPEALTPPGIWRTGLVSETALNVKGMRFGVNGASNFAFALRALHLYGEPAPGSVDRLAFWSATADQKMNPATPDFGDVPRSSSDDFVVRVKNLSATKTAGNVRVAFDILTDGTPTVPGQHMASLDGVTFFAQVNLGSLAPGAISAPVTIRRVTPSNAQLGLFAPRMSAVPDTWA